MMSMVNGEHAHLIQRQRKAFGIPLGVRNLDFVSKASSGTEVRLPPAPRDKHLRGF